MGRSAANGQLQLHISFAAKSNRFRFPDIGMHTNAPTLNHNTRAS